ncbi:MAG: hypothetical protein Q9169_004988 [Polycauliona sp. 2 TL-2023]
MVAFNHQVGVGDFYTVRSDPSLKGVVERVWHDVEADPYEVQIRFLVHKDLPDSVRQQLKRSELLPKNYVILGLLWSPKVNILVHTSDLILIDKYFSRGDVVKRDPSNAQSGTVIGGSCSCDLRPCVSVSKAQEDRPLQIDFAPKDARVADVDTHKLAPYLFWNVGDTVVFQGWVGMVKDIDCATTIKLEKDDGVVVVDDPKDVKPIITSIPQDFPYVRLDGKPKIRVAPHAGALCHPGQRVRVKKTALARASWISGTFNATRSSKGLVLNVRCGMIRVEWRMPKPNAPAVNSTPKPAVYLMEEQLDSGEVTKYDFSKNPVWTGSDKDPLCAVTNIGPSDYVIRRDTNVSRMRSVGFGQGLEQHIELHSGSSVLTANPSIWFVAEVTSTTTKVKVQWQDNSITDELSSNICSYNEVDDHDVWPGEIVSLKGPETLQRDSDFELMLRTRAVEVVQSVNAVERIARIRWLSGSDVTITGENYDVLVRPHSKLGKISDEVSESSLYEIGSYHALTKRRGDLVRLERRPKELPGQSGISWLGEVIDLLPNGMLLVRLGSLDVIRDVKCSVLDVTTVASADDDTTDSDSSGSESLDDWEDEPMGGTVVEYEGSAPSDHDEEGWETDSDHDVATRAEASIDLDETLENVPPAESMPDPPDIIIEDSMDVYSPNNANMEQEDSHDEPPTIENQPGPPKFEVLEGSAPRLPSAMVTADRSKEWLRSVSREHKILRTSLPEGVYVRTWESDMEFIRVLIIGPTGTPYAHAPFVFDITLHSRFPAEAPTAFFHSWTNGVGRVNPNLYENGKVCLSLLGTWDGDDDEEEWVPGKSTVLQIIVSLLGLVLVKEPFYNEAGFEALQGTAQSKPTSAIYSEKAFVLSRGFVDTALKSHPDGCDDIIKWLYLPSYNGPALLLTIVSDCQEFLQQGPDAMISEDALGERRHLNLERYHIDSARLSKGILILLRKIMPDLEDLLSCSVKLTGLGNYKPPTRPNQKTRIQQLSKRPSRSHVDLTIKNRAEDGAYKYAGGQQASGACALIYNPSTRDIVLEKLDVDFTFNLQTSPSNNDRNEVTSQYPQLNISLSDNESENGNSDSGTNGVEATEPDLNNPYDYRHFLKRRRTSSPEAPSSRPSFSPTVPPNRISRTSIKPKPRPRPMQRSKRPTAPSEKAKQEGEESDDGGLTIEMGDDPRPRRFGNGAVVFNHDKRNGPISLRSAASSMSPASMKHDSGNEDMDNDRDVEHLQLPSPAGGGNRYNVEQDDADDDDDDDVVDDLIEAMESQAEEEAADAATTAVRTQPIRSTIEESSSESEEE